MPIMKLLLAVILFPFCASVVTDVGTNTSEDLGTRQLLQEVAPAARASDAPPRAGLSYLLKGLGPVSHVAVGEVGSWKPECGSSYGRSAVVRSIQKHVKALAKRPGNCYVEARTCVKLACSFEGAITWCNDGVRAISRPCGDIAKDAKRVMTRCKRGYEKLKMAWTRGQNWQACIDS
ncbi:uncharacterized protein THITE_2128592 [Thermothielavioides terrestris NRRL 8126]|uniref:Secreted protein n=1 Tax=Thermothielavioides terrestris (strain ATCC 38088 / NRRL 8126) TaxID=578455 RepID=G2R144_THETT|nr:uncharacterized protein THITE_2128592 [Thermothielavioides terrestris NRRL 8126]AEO66541.1 hypothetical protein THITE_2128592 [Thermothielavioides terrestris NRRL 8126]